MKRGLFLDLDGTLANTLPLLQATYYQFLQSYGRIGSSTEFDLINGPPLNEVIHILQKRHQLPGSAANLLNCYKSLIRAGYLDTKPSPGAAEILALATEHGWCLAVVTSNSEDIAQEWLKQNNFAEAIQTVIGQESIKVGKPDPEPYLLALKRVNCSSEKSIAVEDSAAGIASATRAKIRTFAYIPMLSIPHPMPKESSLIRSLLDLKPWLINA